MTETPLTWNVEHLIRTPYQGAPYGGKFQAVRWACSALGVGSHDPARSLVD